MPGLIALWDFARTEDRRWVSVHDPRANDRSYPIDLRRIGDPRSYRLDEWPYTDAESRLDITDDGPLGKSVRFHRGYIFGEVPRAAFDRTPLDLSGRRPFTFVAWVKFTGRRHLVAGVWDEGGWDPYGGRRQFALFGGLFGSKGVIAHVSATGAASYPQSKAPGAQYARLKAIDGREFEDGQWVCMAMVHDPVRREVSAYLDGVRTPSSFEDPVVQDVFQHRHPSPLNPVAFDWPIYSPRSFVLKFNGYTLAESGVAEHWLQIDAERGQVVYDRSVPDPGRPIGTFRARLDVRRDGKSLLPAPLQWDARPGASATLPREVVPRVNDELVASLFRWDGDAWAAVGTELRVVLREGAPLTFGRALGLGGESLDRGSELRLSGVAVFDRVLAAEELRQISF